MGRGMTLKNSVGIRRGQGLIPLTPPHISSKELRRLIPKEPVAGSVSIFFGKT
jgi:hypothetical protein